MDWYRVIKTIKGRRYHYLQKTYRQGKSVKTLNRYIGRVDGSGSSRMTDGQGNPLRVYHGTLETFDQFDLTKAGKNTGWKNANFGIFFSDAKREVITEFVEMNREPGDRRPVTIKEAYLNIRKPLDLTEQGIFNNEEQAPLIVRLTGGDEMGPSEALEFLNENIGLGEFPELMEALYLDIENKKLMQAHGYDGIISSFGKDEKGEVIKEYVAFDPSQIEILPPAEGGEDAVCSGKDH